MVRLVFVACLLLTGLLYGTSLASAAPRVSRLAAGGGQTCATMSDGTLRCWGDNRRRQVGYPTASVVRAPVAVAGVSGAIAAATGGRASCAVLSSGALPCWGNGQLGFDPWSGGLPSISAVAIGAGHSCALGTDKSVRCWGFNESGQLGNGGRGAVEVPSPPSLVANLGRVITVAAGGSNTCVLVEGGQVKCWGDNRAGQATGNGTSGGSQATPQNILGIPGSKKALAVGGHHACVLMTRGTVKCWGRNDKGQLGDGTANNDRTKPVTVKGLSGVKAIAAGASHTCALLATSAVRCWGDNAYGQLGDGTTALRTKPKSVLGINTVVLLAVGDYHTCVKRRDGRVKCWGQNQLGQLGNNSTTAMSKTSVTVEFSS